jgi:hypothetical protein
MRDEIQELIRKELSNCFEMGLRQSPTDAENSEFYRPLIDLTKAPALATEINTLTKEHYMKFIEWLFSKDSKYAVGYGSKTPLSTTYNDYTIEQVYQFWLDNICK